MMRAMLMAIAAFTLSAGCASRQVNLVENRTVVVERRSTPAVEISNVQVLQLVEELFIKVVVRPEDVVRNLRPGHVRIEISDPDQQILAALDVKNTSFLHRERRLSSLHHAEFWVRLPMVLTPGSMVRVTQHEPEELRPEHPSP